METAARTVRRGGLWRAIEARPTWAAAAILVLTIGTMLVIAVGVGGPMKDFDVYLLAGRAFGHGADLYADGFGHGLVHLWAEDGTLLATASQSCMVRYWTPEQEDELMQQLVQEK